MVRNTRPYIGRLPERHDQGQAGRFPRAATAHRRLRPGGDLRRALRRDRRRDRRLSLAPYKLEAYKKKSAIRDDQEHKWEEGREVALVGIFKTRFLKRLESSIEAFRLSLRRALTFEETYLDYLLDGKVVSSKDFQKAMRFLARDEEDEHSRRQPGRRTRRRGRGQGVHREPAPGRPQRVRPAEAAGTTSRRT